MNLDYLLELALKASNEASKAILKEKENLKIWQKEDGSPISSADIISNEILSDALQTSDIAILSEECIPSIEERKNFQTFWLIDPLDGTSGFLKNSNEYCILIALIDKMRPVLALIQSPTTMDIYYAHCHTKVYKNSAVLQKNLEIFEQNKNTALLSIYHRKKCEQEFINKHYLKPLSISSGLKFCALLEGKAGVYKRNKGLSIWDIAAGDFLINKNEGIMCDFNGKMLTYNALNLQSQSFIALSQKEYLQEFIDGNF
ncbi:inositol monophosphatase family protein [Campylobacter sp. US33a]|uniref:3'(2'),5-bisphosphonucleoside 3'(2')-phosphohydrolase n=1 Tax=Campylobacter sp. CCS1377 TaxID=3158229 RepID=A0AAU7E6Z9_9BACT|nr:inositol monophosphatase family protein [Campylobacter sp. US33a]MCW1360491.1 3'(2'),5'-bisphosphate nucleotidase CysQ [Campylobacter jejuni]TEY04018.1 3'(2'),5'-bisphosphate nucleotidase CysQ [Campylobacter sp. US33a]